MGKWHGSRDSPRMPQRWWNPTSGRVLPRVPAPSAPGLSVVPLAKSEGRAPPRYRSSGWRRDRFSSFPRPASLPGWDQDVCGSVVTPCAGRLGSTYFLVTLIERDEKSPRNKPPCFAGDTNHEEMFLLKRVAPQPKQLPQPASRVQNVRSSAGYAALARDHPPRPRGGHRVD